MRRLVYGGQNWVFTDLCSRATCSLSTWDRVAVYSVAGHTVLIPFVKGHPIGWAGAYCRVKPRLGQ